GDEEHRRQNGGRARERVRLPAPRHEIAGAPARTQRSAFGALEEHDRDQGDHNENMDDDEDRLHEEGSSGRAAALSKPASLKRWRAPIMAQEARPSRRDRRKP